MVDPGCRRQRTSGVGVAMPHADGGSAVIQVGYKRIGGKVGVTGTGVSDASVGLVEVVVGGTMGIKVGQQVEG